MSIRKNFSFATVSKKTAKVSGSTTLWESKLLYTLACRREAAGVVVEIGSFLGRSTIFLASGSKRARQQKVYAIDPHQGAPVINKKFSGPTYQRFLRNIEQSRVADMVVPIPQTSDKAFEDWRQPIRLLFIDGDHSYQAVRRDLKQWGQFVVDKGVIAVHDALNPGVGPPRAIVEVILAEKKFSQLGVIDSVFFAIKSPPQSAKDWINWYIFALAMNLVSSLIRFSSANVPRRLKTVVQQIIVKTWMKRCLTAITQSFFSPFRNY